MGATDVHNEKSEAETQNKQTQFKELEIRRKKKSLPLSVHSQQHKRYFMFSWLGLSHSSTIAITFLSLHKLYFIVSTLKELYSSPQLKIQSAHFKYAATKWRPCCSHRIQNQKPGASPAIQKQVSTNIFLQTSLGLFTNLFPHH